MEHHLDYPLCKNKTAMDQTPIQPSQEDRCCNKYVYLNLEVTEAIAVGVLTGIGAVTRVESKGQFPLSAIPSPSLSPGWVPAGAAFTVTVIASEPGKPPRSVTDAVIVTVGCVKSPLKPSQVRSYRRPHRRHPDWGFRRDRVWRSPPVSG